MSRYLCYALTARPGYVRGALVALLLDKPADVDAASPQAIAPRVVVARNREIALAEFVRLEPYASVGGYRRREGQPAITGYADPDVSDWGDRDDKLREMFRDSR